jgi:hypothetical protein
MFWLPKATATGLVSVAVLTLGLGIGLTGKPTGPTAAADPPAKPADPPKKADPDQMVQRLQQELDELRAQAEDHRKRVKQAEAYLQATESRLDFVLKRLEELKQPAGRRLVVSISDRRDKESLVITEYKDGDDTSSRYWTVTFSRVNWTDADLDIVRDYLARAASDKTVAREVKIVTDKQAPARLVTSVARICGEAGFTVGMAEFKPRDPDRVSPADDPELPGGIQVAVPEDGTVTGGPEGAVITIPVGGTARITLSEGKFVELHSGRTVPPGEDVEGDVISPSINALGVITIRGLKPGGGSYVNPTDDRGRKRMVRVNVVEKGPGR